MVTAVPLLAALVIEMFYTWSAHVRLALTFGNNIVWKTLVALVSQGHALCTCTPIELTK